jgi:uncharacterized membrane protein YphA (DoxX/SURF4 family)
MSFRGNQFNKNSFDQQNKFTNNLNDLNNSNFVNNNNNIPHSVKRNNSFLDIINNWISSDNSFIKTYENYSDKLDNNLDIYLGFAKPYVPSIGRFFIVATFIEDSLRISTQWKEQVYYLSTYRNLYEWIVKLFLLLNIIGMIFGSILVILRKQPIISSLILISIVLLQGLLYGLFFDPSFFLRNISVIGGLLLALSDSLIIDKRSLSMPGLPMLETKDYNKKYFLLAGRIMLIVLFLTFTLSISWSLINILIILIGFLACLSIAIGYKTKFAASILTLLLTIHNCITNHYWTYPYKDTRRDYLRYEFFQTLSIIGGLLLIVNTGAGELSIDEKKKKF